MRNLVRDIFSTSVMLWTLCFGAPASAAWVSSSFKPGAVGSISVLIDDQATGGCWTNMSEAKKYTEEKLKTLGFHVVAGSGAFIAKIMVLALRDSSGRCMGYTQIKILKYVTVDGMFGELEVASASSFNAQPGNLNDIVFEKIDQFIQEAKSKE